MRSHSKISEARLWHPFSQMATETSPIKVVKGEGSVLTLSDGRKVIDGISSWWVNIHGHSHPLIAAAIGQQAAQLEHVIFAGFTHDPALEASQKLVEILPQGLRNVFFSDNGSTAVETALKQAIQYWRNIQQPQRQLFIGFEGGYHGDTVGAMSIAGRTVYTNHFHELMFKVVTVAFPETWIGDSEIEAKELKALKELDVLIDEFGDQIAALVMEPLIQGPAGMRMCRPEFVAEVVRKIQAAGALVIFDEVMTGFGRTGEFFACVKAAVTPDLICLAKGLTGGFLPLAATVCTDRVYEAFLGEHPARTFLHGHSYAGNPICCAAASVSLDLLRAEQAFRKIEPGYGGLVEQLQALAHIEKIRVCGTVIAFDVKGGFDPVQFRKAALDLGVVIRPIGKTIYLLPPYCLTEVERQRLHGTVLDLTKQLKTCHGATSCGIC